MFKFTQVAVCKQSVADNIDYSHSNQVKKSVKGDLQVMLQTSTGMVLFKMNDFQYGINPNDQILYEDKDPHFKLMLCLDANPNNAWILKINDKTELVYFILSQRCKLIHRRASRMIIQGTEAMMKAQAHPEQYPKLEDPQRLKYIPEKRQQSDPKDQSSQYKLIEASKTFASALISLGVFIAQGLQSIGSFFSKKVESNPTEHMKISPIIKFLIDKSVGASKKLLEYNTQKCAKVFRLAANQVTGIQSKIVKTDTGKKLKENGTIDFAKQNLKIGLEAITNVYDGFAEGYDEVTKGISKGANQIISAKYGPDAGEVALKVAEGYRNVNKLPKVANDAIKRVLVQTAKNQIKKQPSK